MKWIFAFMAIAIPARGAAVTWRETESVLWPVSGAASITAEFRFQNTSSSVIGIISVKANCDCVIAAADQSSYQPGELGAIRAVFSLAGREGRQEKAIAVTTTAASGPTLLRLVVEIPEFVTIKPRFLFWQVGEAAAEKAISIAVAEPANTAIGEVLCPDATFSARIEKTSGLGRYRIAIKPFNTDKLAQATIRLNATVEGQPRVFVLYAAVK